MVITDPEVRTAVAEKTRYRKVLEGAPLLIAVFLETGRSYNRDKDIQAVGACLQNMQLAAHSLGLGTVWVGEILNRREEVEKILHVPDDFELMAVLAVGRPLKPPSDSERRSLTDILYKRL